MDARVALTLLALLLAPVAGADHVFSHRVYVVGRVIDSEGLPVPGQAVNVTLEGIRGGRCFDSRPETTSPTGDYEVCRHAHEIPAGTMATVRVAGAQRTVELDPDLRHASASLRIDGPSPARDVHGERTFARTFLVQGRAFELLAAPREEEGVSVDARPLGDNVTVTLRTGEDVLAEATASPDEHGIFRAELAVDAIPPGALVRAVAGRDGGEELASALFRRADLNIVRDHRLVGGPGADAPGTDTPLGAWGALLALAIAGATRMRREK